MEPGGSLPHSQEPATCPCPEPQHLTVSQNSLLPTSVCECDTPSCVSDMNKQITMSLHTTIFIRQDTLSI
jgi:hypothetical protein